MTPISAEVMATSCNRAFRALFVELGVPAETIDVRIVNGFYYSRLRPLVAPDRPSTKAPPVLMVKVLSRLHPEFRRRTKAARRSLDHPQNSAMIDQWRREIRPRLVARNLELQRVDLASLDGHGLADHVGALLEHFQHTVDEHFRLHGYDLGPIGQLLVLGDDWGLGTGDLLGALVGASPSTTRPMADLAAIRAEVDAAGGSFDRLDSVRAASDEAARLLDDYVEQHGYLLFSSYDIDSPTLIERPEVLVASIRSARPPTDVGARATGVAASLRERVPERRRADFDSALAEARDAMDMRDDNGPITVEWPAGLVRRGLLEVGRRLAEDGRIEVGDHVFELELGEVDAMVRAGTGPTAGALAERAATRAGLRSLEPPSTLGPAEPAVSPEALPAPLAQIIKTVTKVTDELLTTAPKMAGNVLSGQGIGTVTIVGTARTAASAADAIAAMEDGEILVTRTTSPAYNLVLSIAGGLVTETGGAMSHAAVLSRELDLTAVIGASGCLDAIANGDRIEVDPVAGTVRVLI